MSNLSSADLKEIEEGLQIKLPDIYKKEILKRKQCKHSLIEELFLVDKEKILELNNPENSTFLGKDKFHIGTDGASTLYFIDTKDDSCRVFEHTIQDEDIITTRSGSLSVFIENTEKEKKIEHAEWEQYPRLKAFLYTLESILIFMKNISGILFIFCIFIALLILFVKILLFLFYKILLSHP